MGCLKNPGGKEGGVADRSEGTFKTSNTRLACYLLATGLLRYERAEPGAAGVDFVFRDPAGAGEGLAADWRRGVASLVHPRVLLESRDRLIDDVKRVSKGAR